jgi:beta-phosphoglucomutase
MKGIIFDLDGVICSTDDYHYKAWHELAIRIGITDFTREDNHRQRGVSRMESLEVLLEKSDKVYSPKEKISMADYKNQIYYEMLKQMTEKDLSDGVKKTLIYLKEKGYKLAIGSSSKNTKIILERIALGSFFDAISDGTNITKSKPDPEVFLKAANYLGLKPKECYVVEDAKAGIDAAIEGGFPCFAIGDAAAYKKANFILDKFEDLMKIL